MRELSVLSVSIGILKLGKVVGVVKEAHMKDDGGPAFPRMPVFNYSEKGLVPTEFPGMSLRDWFAGQALCGILASYAERMNIADPTLCAEEAYRRANAMLKARENA